MAFTPLENDPRKGHMNHHDAKAGYGGFLGGGAPLDSHEDRGRNAASFITLSAVQQDNRRAMRAMGTSSATCLDPK